MKKHSSFLRLIAFEWRKNFWSPWILLFLAGLLGLNGWCLHREFQHQLRERLEQKALYEAFYEQWCGAITPEKLNSLMEIYDPLREKAEGSGLSNAPDESTYLGSEQKDYRFFSTQFAREMEYDASYASRAAEQVEQARALTVFYEARGNTYETRKNEAIAKAFSGRRISSFGDTQHLEVLVNHDFSSLMVLLMALFGLCTVFVTERQSEMYMLQRTAKLGGGATVAAKLLASLGYLLLLCILFYGEDVVVLQLLSGHWEAWDNPVYAIRLYENTSLTMSLSQYLWWGGAVKGLGILAFGGVFLLLSCLCRRTLTAFSGGFGYLLACCVWVKLRGSNLWLSLGNPMELILHRDLVKNLEYVNVFGWPVEGITLCVLGTGVVLALILLLAPVFCEEYASGMDQILLTQKASARGLTVRKIAVAMLLAAGLTLAVQVMELCYCALRFGLPHWDYPIQSLYSLGTSVKSLTLGQGFLLQFFLKLLGYLYCAGIILFLSVVLKQIALTLMASALLLPLPFLAVGDPAAFRSIPGPWALTVGSVYLNPGAEELDLAALGGLALACLGILAGMLWIVCRKNTNCHLRGRKILGVTAVLAAALLLAGCSASTQDEPILWNSATAHWYENDRYLILREQDQWRLTDKQTGETMTLPLDARDGETVSLGYTIYGQGDWVLYEQQTLWHPHAGWETVELRRELVRLDLNTLETEVVYRQSEEKDWFFGLLDWALGDDSVSLPQILFCHDHKCYYLQNDSGGTGLGRMDILTGQQELYLPGLDSRDLCYDGRNLYYLEEYGRLVIHDLDTGKSRTLDEVTAERILLAPEGLYYLNQRTGGTLWRWDPDTGATIQVSASAGVAIYRDEQYLWLETAEGTILRMDHNGAHPAVCPVAGRIRLLPQGDYLLLYDDLNAETVKVDKETLGIVFRMD